MGGQVFLALFFGLFLAIGVGILGFGANALYQSRLAQSWPTASGKIVSSDFQVNSDSDSDTYAAKVRYSYEVMGRVLTGERIAFGYTASSGESFHRDIYNALPVNTQVAVRYDPANPERAVLAYGMNQSIVFLLIFGAVWTMFTVGMIAMFWLSGQGGGSLLDNIIIYQRG
ncbi:MAG: DUF3592 domain-containing protein [Parvularculaceae bacterium]|nr:DUF3592 domain-containing protein [Caulobacterales bacterium]HRX38868.1 DUF3592 domain-containing protein [Parvularculaceae bacterium]